MLSSLYLRLGLLGGFLLMIGGFYYQYHYKPLNDLRTKNDATAKELRAEYIKNSALELELVTCLDDKELLSFEGEMKGAGDAIDDYNITVNDNLIF